MVQTRSAILTLAEFLKLPETKPASEYIEGRIIQKPMPQGKHSTIRNVARRLKHPRSFVAYGWC